MRIHSSVLTGHDIFEACRIAGVYPEVKEPHGSRSRDRAWEVQLSGSSVYSAQSGQWKAATWDEWGIFLEALFEVDPDMLAGQPSWGYDGVQDFMQKTDEALTAHLRYQAITGRKRVGYTAPWLNR